MKVEGKTYGTTAFGERIDSVTIENSNGVSITVISLGATLISVKSPDRDGVSSEITLCKPSLADYEQPPRYFGATVGRFCNRIGGASFTLDGKNYKLPSNDGANCLHGGPGGFDQKVWDIFPFKEDGKAGVKFFYHSPDGEEGFPGSLEVSSVYTLTDKNELIMEYEATADKATPVNMTNHVYWNLSGGASDTILEHKLKINASEYLPVDEKLIPTGEVKPVAATPFDFRNEKVVGSEIEAAGGYDHCYVLKNEYAKAEKPFAELAEIESGRKLLFYTTQPGVQFYTGNFVKDFVSPDKTYQKHGGLCLETQGYPDAPNKPVFPSCILKPGDRYSHRTIVVFSIT